jgi:phage shock protein A
MTMPGEIDPQQFGRMTEKVDQLEKSIENLNKSIKELTTRLDQARGGWKMLIAMASAGAAAATAFAWVVQHISVKP